MVDKIVLKVVIKLLEILSKRTSNKVDDQLVEAAKDALE